MTLNEFVYSMNKLNRKFEKAICCLQASTVTGVQFQLNGVDIGNPGDAQVIDFGDGLDATLVGNTLELEVIPTRFGVAGEDELATENRQFDLTGGNTFKINGENQIRLGVVDPVLLSGTMLNMQPNLFYLQWLDPIGNITAGNTFDATQATMEFVDPTGISRFIGTSGTAGMIQSDLSTSVWSVAVSLNSSGAVVGAADVVGSVTNVLSLGVGAGGLSLASSDPVNSNVTTLNFTPDSSLVQVTASTTICKLEMNPNVFSVGGVTLSNDDGAGTISKIFMKPGLIEVTADSFRVFNNAFTDTFLGVASTGSCSIGGLLAGDNIQISSTVIKFTQNLGKYQFMNVVEYADNAAALVGGLIAGMIYRTGDALKIVH